MTEESEESDNRTYIGNSSYENYGLDILGTDQIDDGYDSSMEIYMRIPKRIYDADERLKWNILNYAKMRAPKLLEETHWDTFNRYEYSSGELFVVSIDYYEEREEEIFGLIDEADSYTHGCITRFGPS